LLKVIELNKPKNQQALFTPAVGTTGSGDNSSGIISIGIGDDDR
jgi:hypothetical protein